MKNRWEDRGDHVVIFVYGDGETRECLVDEADFPVVAAFSGTWGARKDRNTHYAEICVRDEGGKWKILKMHRVLLHPPDGLEVDHKNRVGLDNRHENIRIVTRGENQRNRWNNVALQSDVEGVHWDAHAQAWWASPWVNGKCEYLGRFDESLEAEAAVAMFLETGKRVTRLDLRRTAEFQSDVPGVYWDAWHKAWVARPWVNGKGEHLGYFYERFEAEAVVEMFRATGKRV